MTPEEAQRLQAEVEAEQAREQKLAQYDGLRCQVALMYLDEVIETITREGLTDDGTTPYVIRNAYEQVAKQLMRLKARLLQIDTLDRERQTPCYTIENGKLVKMKLDVLLAKLQEVNGEIG